MSVRITVTRTWPQCQPLVSTVRKDGSSLWCWPTSVQGVAPSSHLPPQAQQRTCRWLERHFPLQSSVGSPTLAIPSFIRLPLTHFWYNIVWGYFSSPQLKSLPWTPIVLVFTMQKFPVCVQLPLVSSSHYTSLPLSLGHQGIFVLEPHLIQTCCGPLEKRRGSINPWPFHASLKSPPAPSNVTSCGFLSLQGCVWANCLAWTVRKVSLTLGDWNPQEQILSCLFLCKFSIVLSSSWLPVFPLEL